MKKQLKINRKVNKKSMLIIAILFFANFMFASVGNANIKITDKKSNASEVKEAELKLENWMLNVDLFEKMIYEEDIIFIEEKEIDLEPWMLESDLFCEVLQTEINSKFFVDCEIENELELEYWMLDIDNFQRR